MSRPRAYYNDHDPDVCSWLASLIKRGLLPDGEIDNRSILDVRPADLDGFTQVHFFAGIGGWPYALRLAGWPDDRPVWTGSPPCQPFSAAGKGLSKDDPRHLAPYFVQLVGQARPAMLFGEQVASADVFGGAAKKPRGESAREPEWAWLDDLYNRLEAACYATGSSDIPAAGVGSPNKRQRTFFGAVRLGNPKSWREWPRLESDGHFGGNQGTSGAAGYVSGLAHHYSDGFYQESVLGLSDQEHNAESRGGIGGMGDTRCEQWERGEGAAQRRVDDGAIARWAQGHDGLIGFDQVGDESRKTNAPYSPWRDADWLFCRDEKWRPVEPGTFPLADGIPARVVRLRGYGNAINPWAAKEFIKAFDAASRGLGA